MSITQLSKTLKLSLKYLKNNHDYVPFRYVEITPYEDHNGYSFLKIIVTDGKVLFIANLKDTEQILENKEFKYNEKYHFTKASIELIIKADEIFFDRAEMVQRFPCVDNLALNHLEFKEGRTVNLTASNRPYNALYMKTIFTTLASLDGNIEEGVKLVFFNVVKPEGACEDNKMSITYKDTNATDEEDEEVTEEEHDPALYIQITVMPLKY